MSSYLTRNATGVPMRIDILSQVHMENSTSGLLSTTSSTTTERNTPHFWLKSQHATWQIFCQRIVVKQFQETAQVRWLCIPSTLDQDFSVELSTTATLIKLLLVCKYSCNTLGLSFWYRWKAAPHRVVWLSVFSWIGIGKRIVKPLTQVHLLRPWTIYTDVWKTYGAVPGLLLPSSSPSLRSCRDLWVFPCMMVTVDMISIGVR